MAELADADKQDGSAACLTLRAKETDNGRETANPARTGDAWPKLRELHKSKFAFSKAAPIGLSNRFEPAFNRLEKSWSAAALALLRFRPLKTAGPSPRITVAPHNFS